MSDIPSAKSLNAQKHRKGGQFQKQYKSKSAFLHKSGAGEQSKQKASSPAPSKLPSNWEKYEKSIEETLESPQVVGIDINTLSLLPTSNSQFQLKRDKVFLPKHDSTVNPGQIFQLDLNLVSLSLATVPFYRRINIDQSLISPELLQAMNRKALDANALYHSYLAKQTDIQDADVTPTCLGSASEGDFSDCDEMEIRTDDLDLVDVAVELPTATEIAPAKDSEMKELEEWLNNVI